MLFRHISAHEEMDVSARPEAAKRATERMVAVFMMTVGM